MSGTRTPVSVDFFADLTCPWCYVGWSALKRAAQQQDDIAASVAWRSFMLSPDTPPEGLDRKAYLAARFPPERLAAAHKALEAAAEAAGVPIRIEAAERIPNTLDAHRLVHWAAAQAAAEPVIDALFHAYFVDGRDIGDAAVLLSVAESAGLDPHETAERLAGGLDRDTVLGFHAAAARIGVRGVPLAVVNRKIPLAGAESVENYAAALRQAMA